MSGKLERIVHMADMFNKGPYPTREEICAKFEIAQRTFWEDLRFMRERLRYDIKRDPSTGRYYNPDPKKRLPEIELTEGEVFALTLGKEMLAQYVDTTFEPTLRSAIQKIVERLPDRIKVDVEDIKCAVRFDPGAVIRVDRKMFMDINKACEKCCPIKITYYSASKDEVTGREVEPYRLLEHGGSWYVVGRCRLRDDLRMFALHRIEALEIIEDERFTPPEDFDVDSWLDRAFQLEHSGKEAQVKIHFKPRAARYIRERRWHETQVVTEHDDRSLTLEFVTQSLDETKRWVLTYGAQAEVLAPAELRDMVARELAAAVSVYGGRS